MCCHHQIVARSKKGLIIWCNTCKVYTVRFKDIVMYLPPHGFDDFKESLLVCYNDNIRSPRDRQEEYLLFRTKGSCIEFALSINDIANLLNLMQMSDFHLFAATHL